MKTAQVYYEYDGLSRLLSADAVFFGGGTCSETFAYDAATNIQARTGPAATYTVDGANRVTSDGAQAFTWDGADRLVQRGADTFAYDALSRAGLRGRGRHDQHIHLRRRRAAGHAHQLGRDRVVPLGHVGRASALAQAGTDRIVHGLGPLYLARAESSTTRLVRDALGSVRAELNDLGVVTKAFRYSVNGAILDRAPLDASPTLLAFTGEIADPSGLIYLRTRWYDPNSGRFQSRDPFAGGPSSPSSLNPYAYVAGSSTRFTDPSGLCAPFCVVMGVGAVAGATTGWIGYQMGCRPLGNCTVEGAAGATVAGAVTGGLLGLAGPAAGSAVAAVGISGGARPAATLLAASFARGLSGALGSTAGQITNQLGSAIQGRDVDFALNYGDALMGAAAGIALGSAADLAAPLRGVHRLSQGGFLPQHFLSSGANAERLYLGAFFGSGLDLVGSMAMASRPK